MGILSRIKGLFSRKKDEPIHAFVFLRDEPLMLDTDTIERIVNRALGEEFTKTDDEDTESSFVAGFMPTFFVKLPDAMLMINSMPMPYMNNPEKYAKRIGELRRRKAVAEHKAWVSVDWMGDKDPETLRSAYPQLGKIAAELYDNHCVALYCTSTSQLIPIDEDVIAGLRSDDPLAMFGEMILPPVVNISEDDPRMKEAVAEAHRRWPEFTAAYQASDGENFSIKAPVSDGRNTEYIWIEVKEIDGESIAGDLANDPVDLQFMRLGSRVRTNLSEMNDWAYIKDGDLVGGFTVKVLQEATARR